MLFTKIMSRRNIYSILALIIALFLTWTLSSSDENNEEFSEIVKISLRDVGNQILLTNQDTTSLVLPVIELEKSKYKLSFEHQLSILPNDLVSIIAKSFDKALLPDHYRVEVMQCADQEVAYSYEMSVTKENTIIPCAGRSLPTNCYTITVRFINRATFFYGKQVPLYILIFIGFILFHFISSIRKPVVLSEGNNNNNNIYTLGSFHFYPEQNKLVKEAVEINLSKKECELLVIFVANPNQIIKRDELTKRVWEDNGVFVGRSLDTYISKLRKILKADDSIKLTNVHGVGYKLEINH